MKATINSHLVSQVLLKRFASKGEDGRWQIMVHDKNSSKSKLKGVDCVASREVERSIIEALEQEWSRDIENEADKAINSIVSNNWAEKHIGAIKDLMALHFIRSQAFELISNNAYSIIETLEAEKNQVIKIYPEYTDAINRVYQENLKTAPLEIVIGILKTYITKTKDYLADLTIGLEVGQAPSGAEFIIGDVPVITLNRYGDVVPVTEANYVGMPITPKYLVSLKKNPDKKKPILLTKEQVQNVNRRQVGISLVNYFSLPKQNH